MATFIYKEKSFYMDDRLDRDLRTKVYPDLMKNDKDNVFLIDGGEGTGKSKFGDILGAHAGLNMECDYDLDSICLAPEEFRDRIQNCPPRTVVIYDEAHRGMGSRRALSEINNILVDLMMEMRQKNLYVLIIMPTFFLLDKYAALFRAKGLFHVYEKKRKRGYWCFFNEKNKLRLYVLGKKLLNYNVMKWPRYRGRFFDQWSIDETKYRAKKLKVFKDKPRITKSESFKEQRDALIRAYFEEINIKQSEFRPVLLSLGIKLNKTQISDIINSKKSKTTPIIEENEDFDGEVQGIDVENDGIFTENTKKTSDSDSRTNIRYLSKEESDDLPTEGGEELEEEDENDDIGS